MPTGGSTGVSPPRLVLDACASGPPILQDGPPAYFEWLVFPRAAELVLVMVNRSPEAEVRAGAITLTEIDDAGAPAAGPQRAERGLGLYLTGFDGLDRFGSRLGSNDPLRMAQNLVKYMGYCGATAAVVPEDLTERQARRRLFGQADEDSTRPDRIEVVRRVLARQGYSLWLELGFDGQNSLPGLPQADSEEALRRGLVRVDSQGRADSAVYHPLHPEVREAMKQRVIRAMNQLKAGEAGGGSGGLVIRLGPGPTLLGTPDTGVDDATYRKFIHDTIGPGATREMPIPGVESTEPGRFAERSRYLAGVGRMPWLTWRTKEIAALYGELNDAVHAISPSASLAVVTPGLDSGPAGDEARRVDRAALPPSQSWRSVGLDLKQWPSGPFSPLVLRGTALSNEALSHDLATSPDLDSLVASRPHRGLLLAIGREGGLDDQRGRAPGPELPEDLADANNVAVSSPGLRLGALPLGDGPAADEPLGHALGALDSRWVFLAEKAAAGQEERLRRFARVLGALPAKDGPADALADAIPKPFGVVVRNLDQADQTFLEIANNSPYPIRLAGKLGVPAGAALEDVGRGVHLTPIARADGSNLVLDLLPYGVAAIKIGAPRVRVLSVSAYPSEAVMTSMRARFNELSAQLKRLNQGLSAGPAEPANCGFEPRASVKEPLAGGPLVKVASTTSGGAPNWAAGWSRGRRGGKRRSRSTAKTPIRAKGA